MPLWAVVLILGATGCGFLFLKAREMESKNTLKKVKAGHKSVKQAARHMAAQPSAMEVPEPLISKEEISMSQDMSSAVARDLAEILRKEEL